MVKGEVEYHEIGNGWIMLRFANGGDRSLVWAERPWHVLGQLLVLREWRPLFDPYEEELEWVETWVRIPRIPTELMNFSTISNLMELNAIGKLLKLDQRSLLRNKIRFVRACISTNIAQSLKSYAEIRCADGTLRGFLFWYEDFSKGCSFCGDIEHVIDECPILNTPPREVNIAVKKAPIFHKKPPKNDSCHMASAKEDSTTTYLVKAKSKAKITINTNPTLKQQKNTKNNPKNPNTTAGIRIGTPTTSKTANKTQNLDLPLANKGKGKMIASDPEGPLDELDEEADPIPIGILNANSVVVEGSSSKHEEKNHIPTLEIALTKQPIRLEIQGSVNQIAEAIDDNMVFDFEFPLEQKGSFLNDCESFETNHFNFPYYDHATPNSGDSIANRIEQMEVDPEKEENSLSDSIKRIAEPKDDEEETTSSKRCRD